MPPLRSLLFVTLQFGLIGAILLTGPVFAAHPAWLGLELLGALFAAWAVLAMRASRLRIMPEVAAGSRLVTGGPYRFVRHPMYTASLLVMFALILDRPSWPRAALGLALFAVLAAKLSYEERCLRAHFPDYAAYAARTRRLVPFVW